mmetsp:Transcript_33294/g.80847  ORF Transcript_33294/g.80847 Transcript_33294/m.80847 type:complete len:285 (-) Transcript_33294:1423-2277(-)
MPGSDRPLAKTDGAQDGDVDRGEFPPPPNRENNIVGRLAEWLRLGVPVHPARIGPYGGDGHQTLRDRGRGRGRRGGCGRWGRGRAPGLLAMEPNQGPRSLLLANRDLQQDPGDVDLDLRRSLKALEYNGAAVFREGREQPQEWLSRLLFHHRLRRARVHERALQAVAEHHLPWREADCLRPDLREHFHASPLPLPRVAPQKENGQRAPKHGPRREQCQHRRDVPLPLPPALCRRMPGRVRDLLHPVRRARACGRRLFRHLRVLNLDDHNYALAEEVSQGDEQAR